MIDRLLHGRQNLAVASGTQVGHELIGGFPPFEVLKAGGVSDLLEDATLDTTRLDKSRAAERA